MLKQRLITASILLILVFTGIIYLSKIPFALIAGLIMLGGLWEWLCLAKWGTSIANIGFLLANAAGMYFVYDMPPLWVLTTSMIAWIILSFWIAIYPRGSFVWQRYDGLRWLTGTVVIVPAWFALIHIRFHQDGLQLFILLLLMVWTVDSAAYFVGSYTGKRLLAPMISPKKTVEGLLGGVVSASLVALAYTYYLLDSHYMTPFFAVIVLTTMMIAVMGDLLESAVKRQAKAKDSGQLLPGHGGILDRLDSLLAAAPIFVFGISLLDFI